MVLPRLRTELDPQGSLSTLTPLPLPEEGGKVDVGPGWQHHRPIRTKSGPGKGIKRMGDKLGDLMNFLDLYDVEILTEGLVRAAGNRSFVGVEVGGTEGYWTMGGTAPDVRLKTFSHVRFVTGCCLFSAPSVIVRTADGGTYDMVGNAQTADLRHRVLSIECDNNLTAYELESCERLCWTIVQLMASLSTGDEGPKVEVVLDVPELQYLLYALDGALNDHITIEQVLRWYGDVSARKQRVVEHCRARLAAMLGGRKVTIRESRELAYLTEWLLDKLRNQGRVPSVLEIVVEQFNEGSTDRNWRMLQWRGLPTDVVTFNGRTYSAALLRESMPEGTSNPLAIEVDNASEGKIYEGVQGVLDGHPHLTINCVSVLPQEPIFAVRRGWNAVADTAEGTGGDAVEREDRVAFYKNDPGRLLVVRNNPDSPAIWPDGTEVTIEEVLTKYYPDVTA